MDKKQIEKYLKENELDIQSARAGLLVVDMVIEAYQRSYKEHGGNYDPCAIFFRLTDPENDFISFDLITSKAMIGRLADRLLEDFLRDEKTLIRKIKKHDCLGKEARKIGEQWKRLAPSSPSASVNFYKKFTRATQKWWEYTVFGEEKGEIIERVVIPELARSRGWSLEKTHKIVSILSHPDIPSVFGEARKEFLELCVAADKIIRGKKRIASWSDLGDKAIEKKAARYLSRYFWMKVDFYQALDYTPGMLLDEVRSEVKSGSAKLKKELRQLDTNFKNIKKEKSDLIARYKFDRKEKKLIRFSQLIIAWVDQRKLEMARQLFYWFKLAERLAAVQNINYRDLAFYSFKESLKLCRGEKLEKREIGKREEGLFVLYERGRQPKYFYGRQAVHLKEAAKDKSGKDIRGTVASRGKELKVAGIARVVHDPQKEGLKAGEILVTTMTRVEFVPLMKKARAIVTDEGGMACHAAIVSRELGIPAVIGTKNATRVLKDGDRIELDLKTGTIRKV